jgi:hypothetical protein
MIQKLSPLSEDEFSCLVEKSHWGYYFTASSSELNKCCFLFFLSPEPYFHSSHYSEISTYLAAPSPTSGSTPTTVSPGPAKSAAARSPVSVATLVLTALAAPLLSYYCLWTLKIRFVACFVPWITVMCMSIAPWFSDYFVERPFGASLFI